MCLWACMCVCVCVCVCAHCRDGQFLKYMYLKYVFEIQNTILYLNTIENKSNVICI